MDTSGLLMELYTTELVRWKRMPIEDVLGVRICIPFVDEMRKFTTAKWRMKEGWYKGGKATHYLFRLDGRSVRHMKRVKIIEACEL